MKYYVVWEGRETGLFDSWEACKLATDGYTTAKYKSFPSKSQAQEALRLGYAGYYKKYPPQQQGSSSSSGSSAGKPILQSWCVDAACSGNPGDMEYRGVDTTTGEVLFHKGPFPDGTNNIGEFLALVHALALLKKNNQPELPIYTDSQTAMAWVRNKKAKTTLEPTRRNAPLFELIERAEKWLRENSFSNPVYKWNTEKWGEIPADFGRKG